MAADIGGIARTCDICDSASVDAALDAATAAHGVPRIVMNIAGIGTATSKGTKVFALAGRVVNTGLIEVPMGTTLREIVFDTETTGLDPHRAELVGHLPEDRMAAAGRLPLVVRRHVVDHLQQRQRLGRALGRPA